MTGSPRFGIETIREAVRRRVAETSLRQVAEEIPMSFSGLRSFLRGGYPQQATRGKLVAWYARYRRRGESKQSRDDVEAAITLLALYLREFPSVEVRDRRLRVIVDRLLAESKSARPVGS